MNRINVPRVIVAGLLAGVVMLIMGTIGNGLLLAGAWQRVLESGAVIPPQGWAAGVGWVPDLMFGLFLAWTYAAIRPRFGPGVRTALKATVLLWFVGDALPLFGICRLGLLPGKLMAASSAIGLVSFLVAGCVAGSMYKEAAAGRDPARSVV